MIKYLVSVGMMTVNIKKRDIKRTYGYKRIVIVQFREYRYIIIRDQRGMN